VNWLFYEEAVRDSHYGALFAVLVGIEEGVATALLITGSLNDSDMHWENAD
jgi:hypothetical protein